MTVKRLKNLNNLASDLIHPGQKLNLSRSSKPNKSKYLMPANVLSLNHRQLNTQQVSVYHRNIKIRGLYYSADQK
jgi:LysM repeat protein